MLFFSASTCLLAQSTPAQEPGWPSKPIRLIVPYAPGGAVDRSARIIAEGLKSALGQPFIVDNRPGGGTIIAADVVAKAEPDGYTLLMAVPAVLTVNPSLYRTLPYKTDALIPVSMIGRIPLFVVTSPDNAAQSLAELFDKGRRQDLTYGTAGNGSMTHLGAELIKRQLGIKMVQVPYKGTSAMLPDLIAGRVDLALADIAPIKGLVESGKLKVLATVSAARSALFPSAPSMVEAGFKGIDVATWVGLAAPSATPEAVTTRLAAEVNKMLADPSVQQELLRAGVEASPMETRAFRELVVEERAKWKTVIHAGNIIPN